MKKLLYQIFDTMLLLTLSDGGDGASWIFVDKDKYEAYSRIFLEWQKDARGIKHWKAVRSENTVILSDGQEFVGMAYNTTGINLSFGEYYIKI